MELADLNLLTYVIKFASGRYYTFRDNVKLNWSKPYSPVNSTDNLVEANIYNDLTEAQNVCKQFPCAEATVHPVSKKLFFEATLKGERQ